MNLKLHILVFSLSIAISAFTQEKPAVYTNDDLKTLGQLNPYSVGVVAFDTRYEGVRGSPFMYENWLRGRILLSDKDTFSNPVHLHLDVLNQDLYYRLDQSLTGKLSRGNVSAFEIQLNNESSQKFISMDSEGLPEGYYKVYHESQCSLLIHHYAVLDEADYRQPYSTNQTHDEILKKQMYVLMLPDGTAVGFGERIKKKEVVEALDSLYPEVEKVIGQNQWKMKSAEDLKALLEALE